MVFARCRVLSTTLSDQNLTQLSQPERYIHNTWKVNVLSLLVKCNYIVTLFLLYNFLLLHRPCFGTFILRSFQ